MKKVFIIILFLPLLSFAYIYAPGETSISSQGNYTGPRAQDESAFFTNSSPQARDESAFFENQNNPSPQANDESAFFNNPSPNQLSQNYTTGCGPQGNGYKLCIPILGVDYIENSLAEYIKIIYRFALGLSGLLVFIMIVWGGIQYTISAGDTGLMGDARDRIFKAILGMALLFLSYIILNTINPDLVSLREPNVDSVFLPNVPPAWQTEAEKESRTQFLQTANERELNNQDELDSILEQLDSDPDNQELKDQALAKEFDTLSEREKQTLSRTNTVVNEIRVLAEKQNGYLSWIGINGLSLNERQRLAELQNRQIQLQDESKQNLGRMQEIKNLQQ